MGISYLPGWGDTIAQNLGNMSQGINKIINPNFDLQQALKAAIVKDPEVLRQYAKIERENPGTLARMGFGRRFGAIIGNIQESPEERLKREEQQAQLAETKGRTSYTKQLESESAARQHVEELNAQTAQSNFKRIDAENAQTLSILKKVPSLSNVDIQGLAAKSYANPKALTQQEKDQLAAISVNPQISQMFQHIQDNMINKARLAIESDRNDILRQGTRGQEYVNLRSALEYQKQAQQNLFNLRTIQQKYAAADQKNQLNDMLGVANRTNPNQAAEIAQYQAMKNNGFQEIKDAEDELKRTKGITLGVFNQSPGLKKAMDDYNAGLKLDQEQANKDATPGSESITDPHVMNVAEAIKLHGLAAVQQTLGWKKLSQPQQTAAQALATKSGVLQFPPTLDVKSNKPINTAQSGKVTPTPAQANPSAGPGNTGIPGGFGTGSYINPINPANPTLPTVNQAGSASPSLRERTPQIPVGKPDPWDVTMSQMNDVINGRDIGDYTSNPSPADATSTQTQQPPMILPPNPNVPQPPGSLPPTPISFVNPQIPIVGPTNRTPQ